MFFLLSKKFLIQTKKFINAFNIINKKLFVSIYNNKFVDYTHILRWKVR
jgi:hypothetical protein